jgi:NTP pyrophosphatase (non-canonical NTP hydrolase)
MTPSKFLETVDILENKDFVKLAERMADPINLRLMHASVGVGTEAGELQDLFKKKVIYGKEVEVSKFVDEIGDLLWYLGVACNTLGVSFDEVMEKNWKKLSTRYGDKFSEAAAINKNKEAEWTAMNNDTIKEPQRS